MYRNILFVLYIAILILSMFLHIIILNIPLQTLLILASLFIGIFIYLKSFKAIFFEKENFPLRAYMLFVFSFIVILIFHDYLDDKTEGIRKGISNFIYVLYSVVLVYIFNNRNFIDKIKKFFSYVLIIYIIGYILSFSTGEIIDVFIFETRTNLAWFLLFLYVVTYNNFSKGKRDIIALVIFVLLLMNSSRSPIMIFVLINMLIYKDIVFSKKVIKYILIGLPVLSLTLYIFSDYFSLAFERLSHVTDMSYRSSTGYRLSVLVDGFNYASQYFFGNGYLSFMNIFSDVSRIDLSTKYGEFTADNSYIELLFDTGWIPLVLLLIFFYKLYQSNYSNKLFFFYIASLMMFDTIYHNNFWILLILSILVINSKSLIKYKEN